MPHMRIILDVEQDGFEAMRGLADRSKLIHLANDAHIEVGALAGGMQSGDPSVAYCFKLPDGRVVIAESSLRLMLTAADTLKAKYGDPRMADLSMPDIYLPPDFPAMALIRAARKCCELARDSVAGDAFDALGEIHQRLIDVEDMEGVPPHGLDA